MVRWKRFELLTYRFVACCSIQLSYQRVRKVLYVCTPKRSSVFLVFYALVLCACFVRVLTKACC